MADYQDAEEEGEAPSYVTRGSAYWLWYQKTPNLPAVPMGISSSKAPSDIPSLYSIPVGSSGAARFGEMTSHGIAELVKLFNRYLTINKILPPHLATPGPGEGDLEDELAPLMLDA